MFTIARSEEMSINNYKLDLSFDNVLRVYELIENENLEEVILVDVILEMLIKNDFSDLSVSDKRMLLNAIFYKFIEPPQKNKTKTSGPVSMDYFEDAKYIYSSFMQAYGIDLIKEQGKLSWMKFRVLLEGLPENTKLKEVIGIRLRKIPKRTKYNAEEIKVLIEQKAFYKLNKNKKNINNFEESANSLFNYLKALALKE